MEKGDKKEKNSTFWGWGKENWTKHGGAGTYFARVFIIYNMERRENETEKIG